MTNRYHKGSLDYFYDWHGEGSNPAVGTVNQILGYHDGSPDNINYTKPYIHKNSTCQYNANGMPIRGTVVGVEKNVVFRTDGNCPTENIPGGLVTLEEYEAWISEKD